MGIVFEDMSRKYNNMDKTNLILDLVKEGKITNEQAKVLLEKDKEYIYYPTPYQVYPYRWYPYQAEHSTRLLLRALLHIVQVTNDKKDCNILQDSSRG